MSRESNAFENYSSIKPLNKLGQLKDSNATARSIDTGFSQAVRLKRIKNDIERPIYMLESNNCYQSIERTRGSVVQKMIKWLSTLDWFSHSKLQEMIEIQIVDPHIYNLRCTIFPLKTRCLFAVYCTLLNDSYLGIYLQKTTTTHTHTHTFCVCVYVCMCVCVCVCVCVVFFFTASKKSGNILRIMLILRQLYQKFCCSYD